MCSEVSCTKHGEGCLYTFWACVFLEVGFTFFVGVLKKKKVLESVLSFRRQTRLQCHTENGKGGKDLGAILL